MIVCENCIHRYVCEDKYTMKPQYACMNFNSGKYIFIVKLEKIREELKELAFDFDDLSPDKELVVDLDNIEEVIDKHISELKGE